MDFAEKDEKFDNGCLPYLRAVYYNKKYFGVYYFMDNNACKQILAECDAQSNPQGTTLNTSVTSARSDYEKSSHGYTNKNSIIIAKMNNIVVYANAVVLVQTPTWAKNKNGFCYSGWFYLK